VEVTGRRELVRPRGLEFNASPLLDFSPYPVHTPFLHDIFETRMLAVSAVAKIAVNGQDRLGDIDKFFGREKTNYVGQARISGFVAMTAPHSSTHREVIPEQ